MSIEFEYVPSAGVETEGAVAIVGFPSFGEVGPIAVRVLLDHLPMRLAGTFQSDSFPPTAYAWKGVVSGPVQVWALDRPKEEGRLLLLNSDVTLLQEDMMPFARALSAWAAERLVDLLVSIEGCPPEGVPEVGVASNLPGESYARKVNARGMHTKLTGVTAALLSRTNKEAIPAVGVYVAMPAAGRTDAEAAAAALTAVADIVPAHLLPEDLPGKALAMQEKVRRERAAQREVERRIRENIEVSYV